ncbi:MAG: glycoside hydrolase family 3 N-terminal domain-containing protein [Anaerolineae bacterium]
MSPDSSLPYRNPHLSIEERVADLVPRLTLEEKIAQISIADWNDDITFDTGNVEQVRRVWPHGLGAMSRVGLHRSPRETAVIYNQIQRYQCEHTRLGIPAFSIDEVLHGVMAKDSTVFPQAIGLASTWNPDLIREVFTTIAAETRARGGNFVLSPVIDLGRDPRWGRTEETYGEDPCLVSKIGVAAIRGLQGDGRPMDAGPLDLRHVIATAKHFGAHGQPEAGINAAPTNYAERELRDYFLAPFEAAVKDAHVQCVMAAYNEINGVPVHINTWLLRDVLRDEWGFDGFITSDGYAVTQLHELHHVVANRAEAARKTLLTGIDFELDSCFSTLIQQVRDGVIAEAAIDQAVARVLRAKFLLGLFEQPYIDVDQAEVITNSAQHQAVALKAAHQSIVLLKNDGVLPLDRAQLRSIAVIGPNAADFHPGGYSTECAHGISVLEGVRRKVGNSIEVRYAEGCRITEGAQGWEQWWNNAVIAGDPLEDEARIAHAVEVARASDVALLVVGENEGTCREGWSENHLGDRDSLDLPGRQDDLVKAVVATGTPTIVLLIGGRPLSINWIAEHVPAILEGWYLGQATGPAVADVLFGDANPGGKLPITFPRSAGQIPVYYYHKPSARRGYLFADRSPLFAFGHGLSYTTFAYSDLRVTTPITRAETATVSVRITNTGQRAGDEVVQLYVHDQLASVTRPVKQLIDFRRITLEPGESRRVEFVIKPDQLSLLNAQMQRVVEPGWFDLMVGTSSDRVETVVLEVKA